MVLNMSKNLTANIKSGIFIVLYIIPRVFGLTAASCNIRSCKIYKSTCWRIYAIGCACAFTVMYPIAIITILTSIKAHYQGKVFVFIDISNYFATYLFCVAIYLPVMSSSPELIEYINLNFSLYDDCKALCKDRREIMFFLLFTSRAIYLYIGNTVLNTLKLNENSEDLAMVPFIYKCSFFIPDMIMASTMIRFRSAITMYIMCCKRINQAFSECLNSLKTFNGKSANERFRISIRAKYTFDKITECHAKLYSSIKATESLSGNLLIFSILTAFAHLSSTVKYSTI